MKHHNIIALLLIWVHLFGITPATAANRRGVALPLPRMLAESQWIIDGEVVETSKLPPTVIGANQTNPPIVLTNYFAYFKIETLLKGGPPIADAQIILLRVQTITDNRLRHGERLELQPGDKFRFFSNAVRLNEDGSIEAPVAGIGEIRPEAYRQPLGSPAPDPGGPISGSDEELAKAVAAFAFDVRTGRPLPPPNEALGQSTPLNTAAPAPPSSPSLSVNKPVPPPPPDVSLPPPAPATQPAKPSHTLWWLLGILAALGAVAFVMRTKKPQG